jgi:hypothetical protein
MDNVVQFKQGATKQPLRSIVQCQLDEYLAALVESEMAIGVGNARIERDIRVIDSVMRSTENPALREHALRQLRAIKAQLLLVSLNLVNAKRQMQGLEASIVMENPKTAAAAGSRGETIESPAPNAIQRATDQRRLALFE